MSTALHRISVQNPNIMKQKCNSPQLLVCLTRGVAWLPQLKVSSSHVYWPRQTAPVTYHVRECSYTRCYPNIISSFCPLLPPNVHTPTFIGLLGSKISRPRLPWAIHQVSGGTPGWFLCVTFTTGFLTSRCQWWCQWSSVFGLFNISDKNVAQSVQINLSLVSDDDACLDYFTKIGIRILLLQGALRGLALDPIPVHL